MTSTGDTSTDGAAGGGDLFRTPPEDLEVDGPEPAPGTPSAADAGDGSGISWDAIEIVARAPKRLVPNMVLAMVTLRRMKGMRSTVQVLAKALKVAEGVIAECAANAPQLLDVSSDGRRIALRVVAPPPWVMDPARTREVAKQVEAERKRAERERVALEKDAQDTPFNRVRARIEALGMIREDARAFTGFLVRTYPQDQVEEAVRIAEEAKPSAPKPYLMSLLKRGVQPRRPADGGGAPRARTAPRTSRPDGTGRTSLIGWEDRLAGGVRHKLFRLPDGNLRRERPAPDEAVPSLDEDPGYRVAA